MESKQKFYTVFSLRLAGYLMMHGFVLMDMREHIDGSGKKVFYFMKSPELEKLIGEYNISRCCSGKRQSAGKYNGEKCTRGFSMMAADFNKLLDILKEVK